MCVDLRYSHLCVKTEADVFWKLVYAQGGKFITPFRGMEVELDRIYYETSENYIESLEGAYIASFHAWKEKLDDDYYLPCFIIDFAAQDYEEVAGRVMYIFSEESWAEYQSQLSSRPIDISENGVSICEGVAL